MLPQPLGPFKLMLIFVRMIIVHERGLNFGNFERNMFRVGLRSGAYKLISFKLGVMIDMTKLCIWIPA